MSHSAETRVTLTSDPDAEIYVVRGDFQLEQSGVGSLTTDRALPPGLYKLKVVRAGQVKETLVELPVDGSSFDLRAGVIESALPSAADYKERAGEIDGFLRSLRQPARPPAATVLEAAPGRKASASRRRGVAPAAPAPPPPDRSTRRPAQAELVLAASVDSGLQAWLPSVRVLPYGAADAPLGDAASLVDPARIQELPLPGHEMRAAWAALAPDIYRLIGTVNARPMQIAVPLTPGRQTRVFVRRRQRGDAGELGQQEWADLAVQMRAPDASFVLGEGDDYSEVVRLAIARGRPIIVSGDRVGEMLEAKYDDPLVGIAGAHLMLDALERKEGPVPGRTVPANLSFERADIGTVLSNMRRPDVLGGYADLKRPRLVLPDVVALYIRAGLIGRRLLRISRPPLFWESWRVLQGASQNAVLDPALLRAAHASFAWGPYLVFARPDEAAATGRRE